MEESRFVPYTSSLLPGETFTVMVPHPDDEVLGVGGTLGMLRKDGRQVTVHILTDGSGQGDPAVRKEESIRACGILDIDQVKFHDFPDRGLPDHRDDLEALLSELLESEKPDCLIFPGPHESHPDHRALADVILNFFYRIRPSDETYGLYRDLVLAMAEISLPQKINHLVDISSVINTKTRALEQFKSQEEYRDYASKILGLNAYRSTTLPRPATHAEGYYVTDLARLILMPRSEIWCDIIPGPAERSEQTVSLIIRTRNRLGQLREALTSVRENTLIPSQVIVVNDGGEDVGPVLEEFDDLPILPVAFEENRGRGCAANEGLKKVEAELVCFLDDDDLVFPEHFQTLVSAMEESNTGAVYSDAVSVIMKWNSEQNCFEQTDRLISYSRDFDGDLLLYDNYIPFHTVMARSEIVKKTGWLREDLSIFEDWEYLIRLSREVPFVHLRQVTCAYRHFQHGATLGETPWLHPDFLNGRRRVFELTESYRTLEIEEGVVRKLKDENDRIRRDLHTLLGEIRYHRQKSKEYGRTTGRMEADLDDARLRLREREAYLHELEHRVAEQKTRLTSTGEELEETREVIQQLQAHLDHTYAEIQRLNGILTRIYSSKTWKLHQFVEKIRRRS